METKDLKFLAFLTAEQKEAYTTKQDEILDTYKTVTIRQEHCLDEEKISNHTISEVINYLNEIRENYGDVQITQSEDTGTLYFVVEREETIKEMNTRVSHELNTLNQVYFNLAKQNRMIAITKQIENLKELREEIRNQDLERNK